MKRSGKVALVLTCVGSTLACGGLGDVDDRPPLAVIDGQLNQASTSRGVEPASNVRIAVLWTTSNVGYKSTYDVPATPVFPSKFRIELKDPPPKNAMVDYPSKKNEEAAPTQDRPGPRQDHPAEKPKLREQTYPTTSGASESPDFSMAIGSIVAYEDRNGNERLDLVDAGIAPIDRVLGASDELVLVYFEGNVIASPFNVAQSGEPVRGYNLLRKPACADARRIPHSSEPAPPPCGDSAWLPMTTLYDLPLTAEPKFAEMMCQSTTGMSSVSPTQSNTKPGQRPPPAPGPKGWPDRNDPDLLCDQDGKSYAFIHCESISLGLCKGTHETCTQESWGLPSSATTPPPEWPCPTK